MSGISLKQRFALELHRQLIKEQVEMHPLRQLFWESTLRCNMKCRHCGSDCKSSSNTLDMPFEDFARVLNRIKEVYDPHNIMVIISGGEPLMRNDLEYCGRKIYEMGFPWGLVSNGYLMTPQKIKALIDAGLHSISISLDGLESEHDWMRGVPGSYKKAVRAIQLLSKETFVNFDVVTCVNQKNFCYLTDIKELLLSLGVKNWRLLTIFPVGRAANEKELQLSSTQFRGLLEFIRKTRIEGLISANYGCEGFLGEYEGKVRDYLYTCQAGISTSSVMIDGSISACASIRSNFAQGNIYEDDFIDVWENRYQSFRDRRWMKKGECEDCKWFRYCNGNGMHLRDQNHNLIMCHIKKLQSDL